MPWTLGSSESWSRKASRIAAALLTLTISLVAARQAFAEKPNFILLMGDDHGWSETGYNGHPHLQTPVLDEMAASGLQLNHFYSGHPTCSPTRGSVLTGRHPNRYGTFHPGWSIRPEEVTVAHLLAGAGYHCAHFGKWHLGPVKADSPTNPRAMGFHEYVSHDNFYEMNPIFSRNGAPPEEFPGEGSEVTIDETIEFIDRAKEEGKPFLAVVWFGSPHEPYSGLEKDLALYDDLPEGYADRKVRLTSMKTGKPTTRPLRDVLRERYAEITAMDRAIGTLREHLDEAGLRDNTLVWYCGDNGSPPSCDRVTTPFRGEKALMYEGGVRVPGVIEWPARISKGRESDVNAVTSDMLPTLCSLAGVSLPQRPLDGIDLTALIEGDLSERPSPIGFWSYNADRVTDRTPKPTPYIEPALQEGTTPLVKYLAGKKTRSFQNFHQPPITEEDYRGPRVLLDNRYKLVVDGSGDGKVELFDLEADREEKNNLASSKPETVARLQRQLRTWQDSVLESLRGADYAKNSGQ
ncbi:Arylsulfatase [Planctomycetes bacterium Pan216]|uniref:Arylsulfatase n=1 Tax=Kolteria novifilia TaxID=2527975 RepID=A0A518B1N1_9BACT|nr:Arylsulfatase [Planctomycetes bacterium Pan216]